MSLSPKKNQTKLFLDVTQFGFTFPLIAIFVAAFLIIPLGFWLLHSSQSPQNQVMGVNTTSSYQGTVVKIVSKSDPWDLYQYLCKSLDDCKASLSAGKKWETTHGGVTEGTNVLIGYDKSFNDYAYLKVFVKQGTVTTPEGIGADFITRVGDTDVLLLPVQQLEQAAYQPFLVTAQ